MFKRWTHSFDPQKETIQKHHIQVLIPSLPLEFRNKEAIMAIGNELVQFLHVEPNLLIGEDKRIYTVLVEIDVHKGLLVKLEIEWRGRSYNHILDYWGIPFHCSIFFQVGQLRRECLGHDHFSAPRLETIYSDFPADMLWGF